MTGELAPLHQPEDRCHRCGAAFAVHVSEQLTGHYFTPIPVGLVREFVLTDQARRYLAFDALYWRRA